VILFVLRHMLVALCGASLRLPGLPPGGWKDFLPTALAAVGLFR